MGMMEDLHSPDYEFYQTFCEPADVGFFGTSRKRTYVFGAHVERTSVLHDPLELHDKVRGVLSRRAQTRPRDYLIATDLEVRMEAQDLCRKRGVRYQETNRDLSYVLTKREGDALREYELEYFRRTGELASHNEDLLVCLGDNPSFSLTWSLNGKVPCYRKGHGLLWSPKYARWVTARERLCSMAWPVLPAIADSLPAPCVGATDIKRASDLAGNAMHFINAGAQQLLGLAAFGPECPMMI